MEEKIISVEMMRKSDAYTIANFVPGRELMLRAANGVYESYKEWAGKRIAIVVGGGNNGGDGYALAGILAEKGIPATVIQASDKMSEDGKYYCDIAKELSVEMIPFTEETDPKAYDVIVDCILGTGFTGEVKITFLGDVKIILTTLNKAFIKRSDITEEGSDTATDLGDYLLASGRITREEYDRGQEEAKRLVAMSECHSGAEGDRIHEVKGSRGG